MAKIALKISLLGTKGLIYRTLLKKVVKSEMLANYITRHTDFEY